MPPERTRSQPRIFPQAAPADALFGLVLPTLAEQLGERVEERARRLRAVTLEGIQGRGEASHGGALAASTLQHLLGTPGPLDQVERRRGLVGEHPEQLHLREAERRALRPV